MTELGLTVLFYADIERSLKLVLPFIRQPGTPAAPAPYAELQELLRGKKTMGLLAERLKSSVEIDDPEGFSRYVAQVVEHRNEVIHAFRSLPFGLLRDASECSDATAYLKDRRAFAEPLGQLLRGVAVHIGGGLEKVERFGTSQSGDISLEVQVFQVP